MMMGRVRLKSKSAAFSISSAREGGAKANEVAARRERDLRVGMEEERVWGFGRESLRVGILGRVMWRMGSLGEGVGGGELVETGIKDLEEAIIMLAMAELGLRIEGLGCL